MRSEIRERLGERNEDFYLDSTILRYLNIAARKFCHEEKWEFLYRVQSAVAITTGQTEINLIDEVDATRHFNLVLTASGDNNFYIPQRVTPQQGLKIRSKYTSVTSGIRPEYWYLWRAASAAGVLQYKARLVPLPDKAYTAEFHYLAQINTLAADADELQIPEQWQPAVIAYATAMMWLKEFDGRAKSDEQFSLYGDILASARKSMKDSPLDQIVVWGRERPEGDQGLGAYNLPLTLG